MALTPRTGIACRGVVREIFQIAAALREIVAPFRRNCAAAIGVAPLSSERNRDDHRAARAAVCRCRRSRDGRSARRSVPRLGVPRGVTGARCCRDHARSERATPACLNRPPFETSPTNVQAFVSESGPGCRRITRLFAAIGLHPVPISFPRRQRIQSERHGNNRIRMTSRLTAINHADLRP